MDRFTRTRLDLIEYAAVHTLDEFLSKALDEIGMFVESPIGFYHFVDSDQKTLSLQQWSTRTLNEFCRAEGKGTHYSVEQAGVWVDCLRRKKPVIHNDYDSLTHKKGMPEGHARVVRELVVPVIREGKVVAIMGLGNKPVDYTEEDAETVAFLADVTWEIVERKRVEEAWRESAELYSAIVNQATESIVVLDPETLRFVEFNDAACSGLGYSREEFARLTLLDIQGSLTPGEVRKRLQEIVEAGHACFENRHRRKDGTILDVLISNRVINLRNRKHSVGLWLDITDRKRAEKSLQLSEEKYRRLFEDSVLGIYRTATDGKLIEANPALARMFGFDSPEEAKSQVKDVTVDFYADTFQRNEMTRMILESTGSVHAESLFKRKDGSIFTGNLYGWAVRDKDGSDLNFEGFVEDITERKRAEEALISANRQLNDIIEFLPDGTFVVDKDKKVIAWNRVLEEMTGVSKREMIGQGDYAWTVPFYGDRRPHLIDLIDAHDEELASRYQQVVGKGGILRAETYVPRVYEGRGAYVLATVAPLFDAHGKRAGAIESIRDITEQKMAEEALKRSEEKYRELVESANSIILRMDNHGEITFINEFAQHFFGYREEELLGKNVVGTIVPPVESTTGRDLRLMVEDIGLNPESYTNNINENMRCDGERVWIAWTNKPIRDDDGRVVEVLCVGNDITERKQVERSLQLSEEKYRRLFEDSILGIFRSTVDGRLIEVNPAFAKIFAFDSAEQATSLVKDIAVDIYVDPSRRKEVLRELLDANKPVHTETLFKRKDGSTFAGNLHLWVAHDDGVNGNQLHFEGFVEDISERKQAEEALRESQQQLANIIDFLPDATFVIDQGGKVIAWNQAMEEMTGISAAQILGKGNYEYALPFYGERRPILIDLVLKSREKIEREYVAVERRGNILLGEAYMPALRGGGRYLFGTASALYDSRGNLVGAIEAIRDTTERRHMEEAIAKAEEEYRNIFENSVAGIYQVTVDGRFLNVNTAIANLHGYDSPEEFLKEVSNAGQLHVHPDSRSKMLRQIEEHGLVRGFDVEMFRKDKSVVWASLNVRAVRDKDGKIAYLEGTALDITESKLLRAQLEQAQKMESVGRLAGGIAHDFNNMLGVITGRSELALLKDVSPDVRDHLEEVLKAGRRSADLTRQLLAFARKQTAAPKILDLNDTISGMLKMLRRLIREDIDLSWTPRLHLWEVKIDPSQVDQILANLLVNAGDAISGSGAVTIRTENMVIDDSNVLEHPEFIPGDYVLLTVSDTGAGMSKEVCEKIFEPFFTTKEQGKGTGLGLSTVYGIVKQNGGFIYVVSRPGEGTMFKIYLPRFETKVPRAPVKKVGNEPPRGRETVLLVEDDKSIRDLSRIILEKLGYTVLVADTSARAMQLALDHHGDIDLLISDVVMPKMNGRKLAQKLGAIRPNIKCLFMSGYTADVIGRHGVLDEGIHFIHKPFQIGELAAKVRQVLDSSE
jgi:PAS domain S-box-containing protein